MSENREIRDALTGLLEEAGKSAVEASLTLNAVKQQVADLPQDDLTRVLANAVAGLGKGVAVQGMVLTVLTDLVTRDDEDA